MSAPVLQFDPFADDVLAAPYAHHDMLRESGPVVWLEPVGCYAMARYEQVGAALKDWETFVSGRGVGLADFATEAPWRPPSLLLEVDPPIHDRTRKLMSGIASLASLKQHQGAWQAKADVLVEGVLARGKIEAIADLAVALPMALFPDLIGLPQGGREHLIPYAASVFNGFGPRNRILAESMNDAADALPWIAHSCKRENLSPGGWGAAVYDAADRGECSHDEAERLVRSFLSAGVDTTVTGLGNLIHALSRHPDQWQYLRCDPRLARRAFEESLRWEGTAQTFFRTTSREVVMDGVSIPAGAKVMLFLGAANRDPRHWHDPDIFDISRVTSGHVGFGFGIHQCLGQMVARLEAEVLLNALIRRVAEIRPAGEPRRLLNNTIYTLASLPVELVPA